ncbi:MAG TPA: hypothetical protein VJ836_07005 [Candidatus Saccharimonadales bacterium]|nr:hypothetical protein [Candidatus Saccharimonadales bacterium]
MTTGEMGCGSAVDILSVLSNAHVVMKPVEPTRALNVGTDSIEEFYLPEAGTRMLAVHEESIHARRRTVLDEQGLPVFEVSTRVADVELWRVPVGTRPLASILHLIRNDVIKYGPLFRQVGAIRGLLGDSGGPPFGRDTFLMDRFAVAPERKGTQVYFLPPYTLDPEQPSAVFAERFGEELVVTRLFTAQQRRVLGEAIRHGLEHGAESLRTSA